MRATTRARRLRGLQRAAVLLAAGILPAASGRERAGRGPKPVGASACAGSLGAARSQSAPGGRKHQDRSPESSTPTRAVRVTIASRALSLGNNGKVTIGLGADPRWKLVHFPLANSTIPARSYRDIPLRIQVPRRIELPTCTSSASSSPRIATSSGSLQVINQIGSFITVDVPGPRLRKLSAAFDVPSVVLRLAKSTAALQIDEHRPSGSAVLGRERHRAPRPAGDPNSNASNRRCCPPGRRVYISVSGKPAWPVGFVTMKVHVIYPGRTEATTKELTYSKRVLVVNAIVPIVSILFLACASVLWWVRRRRRREPKVVAQLPS